MKKQIQILATTFISVAIVSCSKEGMQMPAATKTTAEEISTTSSSVTSRPVIDPLTVNLEGSFQFNGDLKDQTKKLADGIPTTRGVIYTKDRKGNLKSAIYLDSSYSIKIKSVPQQTHTSLSVWFKPYHLTNSSVGGIAYTEAMGPGVYQSGVKVAGLVGTSVSHPGDYIDLITKSWHHMVVTFDGVNVKLYLDNILKATIPHSGPIPSSLSDYFVGKTSIWPFWKGYVDDLRFYSRTLSATDVQKLYNL